MPLGNPSTDLALIRQVFQKVLGIDLYPVQIQAASAVAAGLIAQVQTGEGKTFITGAAAAMIALGGRHVHVATTNPYLSERDYLTLRPVFRALGLQVSCIREKQTLAEKVQAYRSDVVYGCGTEFGFDFLRDQLRLKHATNRLSQHRFFDRIHGVHPERPVVTQHIHDCIIIDEADSVMIDEAGTPLILGEQSDTEKSDLAILENADRIAAEMIEGKDFAIDGCEFVLSSAAAAQVERSDPTGVSNKRPDGSYSGENVRGEDPGGDDQATLHRAWKQYFQNAVRARHRLRRNVDYVVTDTTEGRQVSIVDRNTGRIHDERRWQSGLHQAVEVKEGISPSPPQRVAVQVTRQRLLQKYSLVCGLTGTAEGNKDDFDYFFGLRIRVFQPHRPCQRRTFPTLYFCNTALKEEYVIEQVVEVLASKRAVIIATRTIQEANHFSKLLENATVPHSVLNGTQDAEESELVSHAGQVGRATVVTSIAGRGTDIPVDDEVLRQGGLHLISTGHYDSPRVDRQLAGRVARQGQPGSLQQVVAPEDPFFVENAGRFPMARKIASQLNRLPLRDRGVVCSSLDRQISKLQTQIGRAGFQSRVRLVKRDELIGRIQRSVA